MSSEEPKKHWAPHLPGILTGTAALLAALTTVYINVRNDKPTVASGVDVSTNAPLVATPKPLPVKPVLLTSETIELKLNRLRVDNDGSMGTTDWTFEVQSAERSLFSVPFKTLSDKAGENLVAPPDADLVHAKIVKAIDKPADIIVRGWKQGWSGKTQDPDVIGQAKLNDDGTGVTVAVKSEKSDGPAFVLYFDARVLEKK
jgi:hypothetical protein